MSAHLAARYRRRARSLRTLADSIESLPLMQLDAMADASTWRGPRPQAATARLRSYQHRLHADAETLRARAWWLEREADDLERSAALSGIA